MAKRVHVTIGSSTTGTAKSVTTNATIGLTDVATPTLTVTPPPGGLYPAYPTMLTGWAMQASQIDTSINQGWTPTTGSLNTSQAQNSAAAIAYGVGPDNDAMSITCTRTPDGVYHAGEARAGFCPMPGEHVVEYYMKMSPLGGGSFPAMWERPSGGGEGEIDHFEWKGKWYLVSPTDTRRDAANCITTPYATKKDHHIDFGALLTSHGWDPQDWLHYRVRMTYLDFTLYINGVQFAKISRNDAGSAITPAEWDRCFASGHNWLLIYSYQWGIGAGADAGGTPDPSILPSTLLLRDVRIWKRAP